MTNGVGEEKTISVSNNLIELIEHIKGIKSLSTNDKNELLTMVTAISCQVNGIHDKLEDAYNDGWGLEEALDNIADELYYNGWYVNEV